MDSKAYLVETSMFNYDDTEIKYEFITLDKQKAIDWCCKYNRILKYYMDWHGESMRLFGGDKYGKQFYHKIYRRLCDYNGAVYSEINLK